MVSVSGNYFFRCRMSAEAGRRYNTVDMHMHSKYSSEGLYAGNQDVMNRLADKYPFESLYEGPIPLSHKIMIDGVLPPARMREIAIARGMSAFVVTDHNNTTGYYDLLQQKSKIPLIKGMEITTSEGNHILAYWPHNPLFGNNNVKIPCFLSSQDTIDLIHEQNGVAVAAHPFNINNWIGGGYCLSEDEIVALRGRLDGLEVFNPRTGLIEQKFVEMANDLGMAITGGSDAHYKSPIGIGFTLFPLECNTPEDYIDAIRARRTAVSVVGSGAKYDLEPAPLRLPIEAAEFLYWNTIGRFTIRYV